MQVACHTGEVFASTQLNSHLSFPPSIAREEHSVIMELCAAFQMGYCSWGERCKFVHETTKVTSPYGKHCHSVVALYSINQSTLETSMSVKHGKANVHESPSTSSISGLRKETNHDSAARKGVAEKGKQHRSSDDRMLKGVDNLIGNIHVEPSEIQVQASEAVGIKNYKFIASYSWKDIEHPTIYVPGLSYPNTRKFYSS